MLKMIFLSLISFFLPSFLVKIIFTFFGAKIGKGFRIGFSIITTSNVIIGDDVKIGHFNLFYNSEVLLAKNSKVGYLNIFKGPFGLILNESAAIGNKNYATRGFIGLTYGKSNLTVGKFSKITVGHHLDLTRSISFGTNSILAGIKSQMWTHGYYHADIGKDRIRIDGEILISDNVYIGSSSIFNPGVKVYKAVHIGAGSVISKDLIESGMYVNQSLRYIDNDLESLKSKLRKIDVENLVEPVYEK